ncbi:MAG: histidine kinase [Saprospiraceae bacterium]|nr:histidine kinase [Saprospiraceae bacterium]
MKHWKRISTLQLYSFIASMPIIDILLNYIMYDADIFSNLKIWLISFPLIFLLGAGSWLGHVFIGNAIKMRYPSLRQTKTRLLIHIFCIIPFMSLSVCVIFLLYDRLHILGYQLSLADLKMGILVGFCVNLIFESLYEADYTLERYKSSLEDKQYMQHLVANQDFDSLKRQVNPDFLFNCFNTLSSLISIDRSKASQFLDELSKVYRYLLKNNQESLTTVENEIKFIESYAKLLRTRYADAVTINLNINPQYTHYLLPSLSLQLLVENAVKHNILSKEQPLSIDIFTTVGNKMIVNNNLQRIQYPISSNKVGLKNIESKYLLLGQSGFQVIEDEKIIPWFYH